MNPQRAHAGIYLHIPFCRAKCDYCGFYSIPVDGMPRAESRALLARYVQRLVREMKLRAPSLDGRGADTLYLGGGTPSLLSPEMVERLIENAQRELGLLPHAEITIECNPEDFSPARTGEYRDAGVNRVVLGVQAFREVERRVIGRRARLAGIEVLHSFMDVPGIAHCMDYIAGAPGMDRVRAGEDARLLLELRPEHISAYMLTLEKGTPLAARLATSYELERTQREAFESVMDILEAGGYDHYEVSNFSLPGFESRHNLKYWRFMPYLGAGASAHSFLGGERCYNAQTVEEYLADEGVTLVRDERSWNAAAVELIMTGIRLSTGVAASYFREVLGREIPGEMLRTLGALEDEGLVLIDREGPDFRVRLTREGFFRSDEVAFRATEPLL